jgi:hypothetical protein
VKLRVYSETLAQPAVVPLDASLHLPSGVAVSAENGCLGSPCRAGHGVRRLGIARAPCWAEYVASRPRAVAAIGLEAARGVPIHEVALRSPHAGNRGGVTFLSVDEGHSALRCPPDAERDRLRVRTVDQRSGR